jgi:hypothetical protein
MVRKVKKKIESPEERKEIQNLSENFSKLFFIISKSKTFQSSSQNPSFCHITEESHQRNGNFHVFQE